MKEIEIDTRGWERMLMGIERSLAKTDKPVEAEIAVTDAEAQKYWKPLEYGSAPGEKPWPNPGPKTRRGKGGRIFSKQAPSGFVFRHVKWFVKFLREAYFSRLRAKNAPLTRAELADAANEAAGRAAELIRAGVPIDSGRLHGAIETSEAK
jgi:hypothetical protein